MSRTGPEYVASQAELLNDLNHKQKNGELSPETADAFIDLYEFAKDIGDRVDIGEAKNANFQLKVDAHQGDSSRDPSVFTANVNGLVKVWPAKMVLNNESDAESVAWDTADYGKYETGFRSLGGVPQGATEASFETLVSNGSLVQFKEIVTEFVSTCREKEASSN